MAKTTIRYNDDLDKMITKICDDRNWSKVTFWRLSGTLFAKHLIKIPVKDLSKGYGK